MKSYHVVGIGNAIVDVFAQADDSFIELMGIDKGIMQLVERDRGEMLYGAMTDRMQAPGGSVANTLAGLGNLGLQTAFIGRVHDDALGRFYARSMAENGTDFVNPPVPGGELPTSRSMIFVSPDGERSMNTYLGISSELGPDDVSDSVAGRAPLLYLEGYLYDKPKGKQAFERLPQFGGAGRAVHRAHRDAGLREQNHRAADGLVALAECLAVRCSQRCHEELHAVAVGRPQGVEHGHDLHATHRLDVVGQDRGRAALSYAREVGGVGAAGQLAPDEGADQAGQEGQDRPLGEPRPSAGRGGGRGGRHGWCRCVEGRRKPAAGAWPAR